MSVFPPNQLQQAQVAQAVVSPVNQRVQHRADPRFRSFVERYVIERARHFRTDHEGHLEDQWQAIQDAKRMYNLIKRVGEGAAYEEEAGF